MKKSVAFSRDGVARRSDGVGRDVSPGAVENMRVRSWMWIANRLLLECLIAWRRAWFAKSSRMNRPVAGSDLTRTQAASSVWRRTLLPREMLYVDRRAPVRHVHLLGSRARCRYHRGIHCPLVLSLLQQYRGAAERLEFGQQLREQNRRTKLRSRYAGYLPAWFRGRGEAALPHRDDGFSSSTSLRVDSNDR